MTLAEKLKTQIKQEKAIMDTLDRVSASLMVKYKDAIAPGFSMGEKVACLDSLFESYGLRIATLLQDKVNKGLIPVLWKDDCAAFAPGITLDDLRIEDCIAKSTGISCFTHGKLLAFYLQKDQDKEKIQSIINSGMMPRHASLEQTIAIWSQVQEMILEDVTYTPDLPMDTALQICHFLNDVAKSILPSALRLISSGQLPVVKLIDDYPHLDTILTQMDTYGLVNTEGRPIAALTLLRKAIRETLKSEPYDLFFGLNYTIKLTIKSDVLADMTPTAVNPLPNQGPFKLTYKLKELVENLPEDTQTRSPGETILLALTPNAQVALLSLNKQLREAIETGKGLVAQTRFGHNIKQSYTSFKGTRITLEDAFQRFFEYQFDYSPTFYQKDDTLVASF